MREILEKAAAELETLNRKDGRVMHGWRKRYRNKLARAGCEDPHAVMWNLERGR